MSGLTAPVLSSLVKRAGSDLSWSGESGSTCRQSSPKNRALVGFLAASQVNVCPWCAGTLVTDYIGGVDKRGGERVELCHVVGRGQQRFGFVPGNVFAGHQRCNEEMKAHGMAPSVSLYKAPNAVTLDWFGMSVHQMWKAGY